MQCLYSQRWKGYVFSDSFAGKCSNFFSCCQKAWHLQSAHDYKQIISTKDIPNWQTRWQSFWRQRGHGFELSLRFSTARVLNYLLGCLAPSCPGCSPPLFVALAALFSWLPFDGKMLTFLTSEAGWASEVEGLVCRSEHGSSLEAEAPVAVPRRWCS